jgi:LPXTG-motif cell wall-anchored protein
MRASSIVTVKAPGMKKKSSKAESFLATVARPPAENPTKTVTKKIVRHKTIEVPAESGPISQPDVASGVTGAPGGLPATGTDPLPFIIAGLLLIGIGSVFAFGSRRPSDPRALLLVALVLMAACVASDPDQDGASGPTVTTTPSGDEDPKPSPSPSDEVKGTLLHRDDHNGGGGEGDGTVTTTTIPVPVVAPVDVPTVTTIVRTVDLVKLSSEDLPVQPLASRFADNAVTLDWSETAGVVDATSSLLIGEDDGVEMVTSVAPGAGTIEVDVTLRNTTSDTRISVDGRMRHVVSGSGGGASLESEHLEITLNPGGEATEHFSYLLPTGSYSLESSFESK